MSSVRAGSKPKVLYIAGYGRSGSTLLAIILGEHPDAVSLGEVSFLFADAADPDRVCACGERYTECEFWQTWAIDGLRGGENARVVRNIERFRSLPRLLLRMVRGSLGAEYRESQVNLFEYVTSRTGSRLMVDSSKSAYATMGRALALRDLAGQDVYVLHLVRDGLATLGSVLMTRSNWELEGHRRRPRWVMLRCIVGWTCVNLAVVILRWAFGPRRYLRLRYEDLVSDPTSSLEKTAEFLDLDMEPLIERIDRNGEFEIGHLVGGNRLRFGRNVRLEQRGGRRKEQELALHQRLVFAILAGWLNRHYGYSF